MRRFLTAAAVAAAIIGLAAPAATASPVRARPSATPACDLNCFDLSSLELGRHQVLNAYVPGDTGTGGKAGQKVNLHYGTNTHPNEDWTGAEVGTLRNFCPNDGGSGLSATAYVCINYPSAWPVFEADWSPYGNASGLCAAAAGPVTAGENVTLQQCGTNASSLWAGDLDNGNLIAGALPWVNGASTAFSHPLALTVDPGTSGPQNQARLEPENALTGNALPDAQEWHIAAGPIS